MRSLTIGGKEYQIEYTFEAAEYKFCVDKAFKVLSGGYLMRRGLTGEGGKAEIATAMIDGTADMVSDMPSMVATFLYAGLLENNPVENEQEAKKLFKQFVKENPDDDRASFVGMYEYLKDCMEEDGFFKLTGLEKMLNQMAEKAAEAAKEAEAASKLPKIPTDHKKKSTSTK